MSVFESGVFMYRAVISNEFIKKHVQMFISIGSLPGTIGCLLLTGK